jgi:hypothetical protein
MRRIPRVSIVFALLAKVCIAAPEGPAPSIGSIDFFGLRTISEAELRRQLPLEEGDPLPDGKGPPDEAAIARSLGVAQVKLAFVCCISDQTYMVFVGVAEKPLPPAHAPRKFSGAARLPEEMMQAYWEFEGTILGAVKSHTPEDMSQGHSLASYGPMRAAQEKFLALAREHAARVAEVLASSADARHRTAAAMILGYAPDKRAAALELVRASFDPDETVRNNATRALIAIAFYAQAHPDLGIRIDADPFIELVNSLVWTDVNKGVMVLSALTSSRDPALLQRLRERARPALIDICRWKSPGHASPGCTVLRRLEGLPEFMGPGSREEVLRAVSGGAAASPRP